MPFDLLSAILYLGAVRDRWTHALRRSSALSVAAAEGRLVSAKSDSLSWGTSVEAFRSAYVHVCDSVSSLSDSAKKAG